MGAQMTTPYLLDTSRPLARAFLTIYLRIHRLVLINFLPALSQVYYAAPSLSWGRFTKSSGLFPTPDTHNVIISTLCTIHYIIVYLIHLVNVFITCDWFMIWSSLNQKTWKLINWQDLQLCIWLINNNSWSKSVVSVSQLGLLRGWFKKKPFLYRFSNMFSSFFLQVRPIWPLQWHCFMFSHTTYNCSWRVSMHLKCMLPASSDYWRKSGLSEPRKGGHGS